MFASLGDLTGIQRYDLAAAQTERLIDRSVTEWFGVCKGFDDIGFSWNQSVGAGHSVRLESQAVPFMNHLRRRNIFQFNPTSIWENLYRRDLEPILRTLVTAGDCTENFCLDIRIVKT